LVRRPYFKKNKFCSFAVNFMEDLFEYILSNSQLSVVRTDRNITDLNLVLEVPINYIAYDFILRFEDDYIRIGYRAVIDLAFE
jgi:hypothetical protein